MVLKCDKISSWGRHSERRNTQQMLGKQYIYSVAHVHLVGQLKI